MISTLNKLNLKPTLILITNINGASIDKVKKLIHIARAKKSDNGHRLCQIDAARKMNFDTDFFLCRSSHARPFIGYKSYVTSATQH